MKNPLEELFTCEGCPIFKAEKTSMWKLILYYIASKAKLKSKDPLLLIKFIDIAIQEIEKEKN